MVTVYAIMQPSRGRRRSRTGREIALSLAYALLGLLALWPTNSMGTQISRLIVSAMADSDATEEAEDSAEECSECVLPLGAQRRLASRAQRGIVPQQPQSPASADRLMLRQFFATATSGTPPNAVLLASRLRC
jgi:hypothetical protein